MSRKIFPLIFGREGGADTSKLHSLVMQQGCEDCISITALHLETNALKQAVINLLFDLIGAESNETARNLLLSLKRDVFNDRDITRYSNILPNYNNLKKAIDLYLLSSFQLVIKKEEFKVNFEKHLRKSFDTIGECWKEHFLANGVLFSSSVVYKEITKMLSEGFRLNKNDKNLLITLTKYFTRSATKTTPFSSLNKVFVMATDDKRFTNINFSRQESRIQVSNLIFLRIKEILLSNENFVRHLVVKPGSAIYKEVDDEDNFHFFVNAWNNEYFKKAKRNPVVLEIMELAKKGIRHHNLGNLIGLKYSQSVENANKYLNALINQGILILQFPVNIDNLGWVSFLIEFIDKNELTSDPDVLEIRHCLEMLDSTVLSLEAMFDISKRWQCIDECARKINKVLNADGSCDYINQLLLSKSLFYENVFTTPDIEVEHKCIVEVEDKLREVFFLFNGISIKKRSTNFLYEYMEDKGIKRMPLLQAYLEIYLENRAIVDSESLDFDPADAMLDQLLPILAEGSLIYPIDISTFIDRQSITVDSNIKFGVFMQLIDNKFDEIVINSFSGGYGSNASRYLGHCPGIVLDRFREYIVDCQGDFIIADVRDGSIHNSNSFPGLASYTIDIAAMNTDLNKVLPLDSLFLSVSEDNRVRITNRDGVVVMPVNFSMEAINRKSRFTQFLDLFNTTDLFGYSYFIQSVSNFLIELALSRNVHMSPRIVFDKSVVLKRKQWHINVSYLRSYIDVFEDRPDLIFMKLNAFLHDYSIPSEVFVRFSQLRKSPVGQSSDNYKPYYINFEAPLSVLVFMNMLNNGGNVLELSEVLPALPSESESSTGRVREFVMSI